MSIFRDDILAGKTALITGGGSGICKGIAETFSAHGANVAITSRSQERLDGAAAEIAEATGGDVFAMAADVREPEQIEAVVAATAERFGGIDILVNGAAGNFPVPAAQMSYKGFRTVMEIDLQGTFNCTKACFEHLVASAEKHGSANVLSITATLQLIAMPFQAHVSAAKAGIDSLTKSLANEWGPLGIRVNAVAPGPIGETEGMRRITPTEADVANAVKEIPLGRYGTIEEIGNACLFLVSDASAYTTGAILIVDGGHMFANIPNLG